MEIERKFLIEKLPSDIDLSSYKCRHIEQGYLCSEPVVRVRRDNEAYYLTYKSKGLMVREEYNLPLTAEAYNSLIKKADGYIITKKRYEIPEKDNLTIELDVFEGSFLRTFACRSRIWLRGRCSFIHTACLVRKRRHQRKNLPQLRTWLSTVYRNNKFCSQIFYTFLTNMYTQIALCML